MIDFIKLIFWDKSVIEDDILENQKFLKLKATYEMHSGIIGYPYTDKFHNLNVSVNDKTVIIKNSLHKLHNILKNLGEQNYNDFTFSQLCFVIDLLLKEFPSIENASISTLEFGLNIPISRPAERIINDELYFFNLKSANRDTPFRGKGCYKQFERTNYIIKVYDKAKHYERKENIARFEVKYINKKELKKLGVESIVDFKRKVCLTNLFNDLLKKFNDLTIVDAIYNRDLPDEVIKELQGYMLQNFWNEQSKRAKRNTKCRHKEKFEFLLKENNLLQTKEELRSLLCKKFLELINQ
jgi:hypothetical protein